MLLPVIAQRRSIRRFEERPVEPEKIAALLEAARLAPSAVNLQPTRVIVATHAGDLEMLASAAYSIGACTSAPCILVCMYDVKADRNVQERLAELTELREFEHVEPQRSGRGRQFELRIGRPMARVNCAIATAYMDLQARALGLGSCWVHHVDMEQVRDYFDIPPQLEILTLLALGYSAEDPGPRPRIPSIEFKPSRTARLVPGAVHPG